MFTWFNARALNRPPCAPTVAGTASTVMASPEARCCREGPGLPGHWPEFPEEEDSSVSLTHAALADEGGDFIGAEAGAWL